MRWLKRWLPLFLFGVLVVPAYAKDRLGLTLGIAWQNYRFKEPKFMRMKGKGFYGLDAAYRLQVAPQFGFGLEARYLHGKTKHILIDSGRLRKRTSNHLFETRGLISGRFPPFDFMKFEPFTGLGYRLQGDSSDRHRSDKRYFGTKRKSQYWYIPLGARLVQTLNQSWSLAMKGEYDFLLRGRQKSRSRVMPKIKHTQKRGHGLKAEIMAICNMGHFDLSFGPYIHHWKIKRSRKKHRDFMVNGVKRSAHNYEPKNRTTETGLAVRVTF